jgi:hypothetical protein
MRVRRTGLGARAREHQQQLVLFFGGGSDVWLNVKKPSPVNPAAGFALLVDAARPSDDSMAAVVSAWHQSRFGLGKSRL